jgi:hypothetical protein
MELNIRNPTRYQLKDIEKAKIANKFIGYGVVGSSTDLYSIILPQEVVNCGTYTANDIVFVSINGRRGNRVSLEHPALRGQLVAAVTAAACIVCDNKRHRNRSFNIGERELATTLVCADYMEVESNEFYSIWRPQ